ncbi:MAG: LysO family transporter [Prevotella sp.]|nr:LysO family transporter [Prevotella sp.]
MLIIVAIILSGILVGVFMRKRNIKWIQSLITLLIWCLLFLLGIEVGQNHNIIANIGHLGLSALVLSVFGVIGSVIMAWLVWLYTCRQKRDRS